MNQSIGCIVISEFCLVCGMVCILMPTECTRAAPHKLILFYAKGIEESLRVADTVEDHEKE